MPLRLATRRLASAAAQRAKYPGLRAEGLRALANVQGPVLTIDLLRGVPNDQPWNERYDVHLRHCSTRIATLRPHAAGVLLGDPTEHSFDRIIIAEHISGEAACDTLTAVDQLVGPRVADSGSLTLWARRSERFGGVGAFTGESLPVPRALQRPWSDCPFAREGSAWAPAQPAAWQQLETVPAAHMYAFNLIRTPDRAAYRHYASHFSDLPPRYGMQFVEIGALDALDSIVVSDEGLPADRLQRASFDLLALAYFPTTRCFVDAWSDPELVRDAFPLRDALYRGGFAHLWLRCAMEHYGM